MGHEEVGSILDMLMLIEKHLELDPQIWYHSLQIFPPGQGCCEALFVQLPPRVVLPPVEVSIQQLARQQN